MDSKKGSSDLTSSKNSKSQTIKITKRNIIRTDLREYEYNYFKEIVESQITESMIANKQVKLIKKVFEDYSNSEIKSEYIIVVSTDVSYFLQQKQEGLLILLFQDVCIFIYKPKHLEVPKILKLDHTHKAQFAEEYEAAREKVKVIQQKGFEDNPKRAETVEKIQEFITLYFLSNKNTFGVKDSKFEQEFHTKLRNHMCVYSSTSYYHTFMGRRLDLLVQQTPEYDQYLEIELNFIGIIPNVVAPYKLVIFNKRGSNPSITDLAKYKVKEILGFFAMLMIFLSLVVCKDFDPTSENYQSHAIREAVCPHKQEMMSVSLAVFFSLMFQKMWTKYKEKREKKIEQMKRMTIEKLK